MLQRLAQLRIALLEFFEQSHVLDGDDRLIGKSFDQRDLLVGERANFFSNKTERSDGYSITQQRNPEHGAIAPPESAALREIGSDFHKVWNMDDLTVRNDPTVMRLPVYNQLKTNICL